ncbi:toprim domain-containing protein [Dactylosporangium sp. NBC_01737]|uniref:toprim domain-containing protein n=1 Tax=Dactylosporangium sp. NBC_01737 TaxID=2975959 RepID=UPI002E143424|nr:toprim domain-containing protein [Dactylosporangium sp. NBC_01737]
MTAARPPDAGRLIAAHQVANEFYRSHLLDEPRALAYLRSRSIIAANASNPPWTIGYAPHGWTILRDHLRANGFTDDELLHAGLITTARNGNRIDVFRDRVMFPIRNADGNIVAFTGRDLSGRDGTPKYRNTTTTAIYHKSELLYGLAEQLDGTTQPAAVMLVEGPADVVAVARLRHTLPDTLYPDPYYAVAPCGTALTAEQVALLAAAVRPGTPIVAAFDADDAGQAAIDKSYQLLRAWPGPVDAIVLQGRADPASLVAAGPATAVGTFAHLRRPLVDVVLDHRLRPHLARLDTRLEELARIGRDPSSESLLIRLNAVRAVAPFIGEVAQDNPDLAARLSVDLAVRLQVEPLTVLETIYPPQEEGGGVPVGVPDLPRRAAVALGTRGFPDPSIVGHGYARTCPPDAPAATWVQHDPQTGHTAWVLSEGTGADPADRDAARLAAEVAGRAAILVGAHKAVEIARVAVNAAFAEPGSRQGNASIVVLCSFDGDRPQQGTGQFTVAWAGNARAYATASPLHAQVVTDAAKIRSWFAAVTVDHTVGARHTYASTAQRSATGSSSTPVPQAGGRSPHVGDQLLTASVRGGTIGVNRLDLPPTTILLAGRRVAAIGIEQLRTAIQPRRPEVTVAGLRQLAGPQAVAMAIRPDPAQLNDVMTAARLARQGQAVPNVTRPSPRTGTRPDNPRLALPAGPSPKPAAR